MNKYQISDKLAELKDYEKICIKTIDESQFIVNYADIINNTEQEFLLVNALFKKDEKMFLYCSILQILPA